MPDYPHMKKSLDFITHISADSAWVGLVAASVVMGA